MIWKFQVLIISMVFGSPYVAAGENFHPLDPQEQRTKAFQKKIDFDGAVLKHVPSEKIVFEWKNVGVPKHLARWKLVEQDFLTLQGRRPRAMWEWAYRKNSKAVGVEITLHQNGSQEALLEISRLANRSSGKEPPYNKGPTDLGTISAADPDGYAFYWAYRDHSFKVESTNKDLALKTAYWINSIAESHRQRR